ncbi:hypothetical protein IMCC3317_11910 [Kordia antarctica]|uniref:Uncharacterized protein n=1 Tax=Kordia antarctica TaxID=1218801 RepID=A0A7L4ZGK1_9FLAO|nr:hypothetical protein [Kordia antarctica]QHI35843.1 hypothetical protein IMCC3317_11910 [Kordia antarctica]
MKKTIILVVLCLFSYVSNGQEATTKLKITESAQFKDEVKVDGIDAMYTSPSGKTAIVRFGKKNILLDVFNSSLDKEFFKIIKNEKKEFYKGHLSFGDEIKVFTVYSPKKKERILYCHTFNIKNNTHTKTELFKANVKKRGGLFSGSNKRQTSFAISPNQQYIAIATDNIKKNSNSYFVHVFDAETLNLIYKQSYQDHKEDYFSHNDLIIKDDATVYSLGKLYKNGRSDKKNGEANYELVLHKVSQNGTSHASVKLEDLFVRSLVISHKNNELHLIGFYSEKNSSRLKGGCNFVLDEKSLAVKTKKITELPKQVYEDLYGYRRGNRKKKKSTELSNFYVDYTLEDTNGNTYILAEEFYVTSYYVGTAMNGGYWETVYHYDDILILKFDANGKLSWGRSIFKRSGVPSYNAFLKNDELHVILNSGKNLLEKKDGRTKVSQGWFESSSLYDIVYSSTGDVSYDKIQDNRGKVYYMPYFGTFTDGKFITTTTRRKKKQFMKLE